MMFFKEVIKTAKALAVILSMLLVPYVSSAADDSPDMVMTSNATLLDRMQIEDMLYEYYWELGEADRGNIGKYWTEDAVFDLNGMIVNGQEAIQAIYNGDGRPPGNLVTVMGNPRIKVIGQTAVVDVIYTGVLNTSPDEAPKFFEQGHDHAELVKEGGRWKFQKRVLRNYSHASAME